MYTAIANRSDWDKLESSRPAQQQGDFAMYTFRATAPQELFKNFSPEPELWRIKYPEMFSHHGHNTPKFLSWVSQRFRPTSCPVGGDNERKGVQNGRVMDKLAVSGVFQESAIPPKRYLIDCDLNLTMGIRYQGSESEAIADMAKPPLRSRLHYHGLPRGLLVFSQPIDDELVQLIILDLRH